MPEAFSTNTPATAEELNTEKVPSPAGDIKSADVTPPFSQYAALNKITYTQKFFDIEDVTSEVNTIEEYVNRKIEDNNLNDTIESYQSIVQGLLERIGIDPNEMNESKIYKVAKFIELISRNLSEEKKLEELLNRNIEAEEKRQLLKDKIYGK